jgi:hypothetical protein
MVDPLTIPGGIASFAQILGMAITSCDVLTKFCLDIHDAPTELHRLRDKLTTLNIGLKGIQNFIEDVPNDKLLPPDLRELLAKLFKQVQSDISALEDVRQVQSKDSPKSIRRRIRWALVDKHSTEKMVQHLRESESTLTGVLQLLNL